MESNDSPEITDREETLDISGLPSGGIFMKKAIEVTEIEIEVWTCVDLLTVRTKIGQGGSRRGKMATVQRKERSGLWKSRY